jgi:hypothetical protein
VGSSSKIVKANHPVIGQMLGYAAPLVAQSVGLCAPLARVPSELLRVRPFCPGVATAKKGQSVSFSARCRHHREIVSAHHAKDHTNCAAQTNQGNYQAEPNGKTISA